ncbi:MAG: PDZ domain-containing protein [Comamonadaceae bacterium]|nr:PDZ domain-containing protein [Comamonadaceae bacterium]
MSRGRIGVVIQEVTKELADSFGLAKPLGALVNSVEKGAPADKAGIEAGDIILKFDGKTGECVQRSAAHRRQHQAGLQACRCRSGARDAPRNSPSPSAEIPDEKVAASAVRKKGAKPEATANRLGLVLSELTAEQKKELEASMAEWWWKRCATAARSRPAAGRHHPGRHQQGRHQRGAQRRPVQQADRPVRQGRATSRCWCVAARTRPSSPSRAASK